VWLEVGDEVGGQELAADGRHREGIEPEQTGEAGIGVKAQAPGVGDAEEEVEGEGVGTAAGGEA